MLTDQIRTRHLFFTGKGGVGKTSLAAATAMRLAQNGQTTLIVSTDPASNLDEVFGTQLGPDPAPIPGIPGLCGANLDPEQAARAYREKVVGPYRGKLPDAVIRNMEEQFSGACTTEIAAFDEFVRLLAVPESTASYDRIVFDTAPTGHTLRLLSLPNAWSGYLNTTTAESSCLGPLSGLRDQRANYESALKKLADAEETTLILVARAEHGSLKEAGRTQLELAELGIANLHLVINALYEPGPTDDRLAAAVAEQSRLSLSEMSPDLARLPQWRIPMLPMNVVGLEALRRLMEPELHEPLVGSAPRATLPPAMGDSEAEFLDRLAAGGKGVIMTMGKGGVGKTSVAAWIAESLARRGYPVLLTTTDPAGNVRDVATASHRLEVRVIDPRAEVERYTEAALQRAAAHLDEDGLALLREDLRSPCTEEIAVFRAFAEAVQQGEDRFVVIDTAPTGHTILLMDATEAYHREVARTQSDAPEAVRQLLPRLRDPEFTRVVLVTLPEPTPVHEAVRLGEDLQRAGIRPFGWVINRSLAAAGVTEPLLASRAAAEQGPMAEVQALGMPCLVRPWQVAPVAAPTGA